jgi:alpha-L-fucosidase
VPTRHASDGTEKALGANLAIDRPVTTSNVRGNDRRFAGWQALDDDDQTSWATDDAVTEARLELDTEGALDINALELREATPARVQSYKVEGFVESAWKVLAEGTSIGARKVHRFPRVTVWKVRLTIAKAAPGPSIRKLGLYLDTTSPPESFKAAAAPRR